jgi:hypothetical protein
VDAVELERGLQHVVEVFAFLVAEVFAARSRTLNSAGSGGCATPVLEPFVPAEASRWASSSGIQNISAGIASQRVSAMNESVSGQ